MQMMKDRPSQGESIRRLLKRDRTRFFACLAVCLEQQYPETIKIIQSLVEIEARDFGPKWNAKNRRCMNIYQYPLEAMLDDWLKINEKVARFGTRTGRVEWGMMFRAAFPTDIFSEFIVRLRVEPENYDNHKWLYRRMREWVQSQRSLKDVEMLVTKFGVSKAPLGVAKGPEHFNIARTPEPTRGRTPPPQARRRTYDSRRAMSRRGRSQNRNPPIMAVKTGGGSSTRKKCKSCHGVPPCEKGKCRARDMECYACGKKGHLKGSEFCSAAGEARGGQRKVAAQSSRRPTKSPGAGRKKTEKRPGGRVKMLAEMRTGAAQRSSSAPVDTETDTEDVRLTGVSWDGCPLGETMKGGIKPFRFCPNYLEGRMKPQGRDPNKMEAIGKWDTNVDLPLSMAHTIKYPEAQRIRMWEESYTQRFGEHSGPAGYGEDVHAKLVASGERAYITLKLNLKYLTPMADDVLLWSWPFKFFMAARRMGRLFDYTRVEYLDLLKGWLLPPDEQYIAGKLFGMNGGNEYDISFPPMHWPTAYRERCASIYYMCAATADMVYPSAILDNIQEYVPFIEPEYKPFPDEPDLTRENDPDWPGMVATAREFYDLDIQKVKAVFRELRVVLTRYHVGMCEQHGIDLWAHVRRVKDSENSLGICWAIADSNLRARANRAFVASWSPKREDAELGKLTVQRIEAQRRLLRTFRQGNESDDENNDVIRDRRHPWPVDDIANPPGWLHSPWPMWAIDFEDGRGYARRMVASRTAMKQPEFELRPDYLREHSSRGNWETQWWPKQTPEVQRELNNALWSALLQRVSTPWFHGEYATGRVENRPYTQTAAVAEEAIPVAMRAEPDVHPPARDPVMSAGIPVRVGKRVSSKPPPTERRKGHRSAKAKRTVVPIIYDTPSAAPTPAFPDISPPARPKSPSLTREQIERLDRMENIYEPKSPPDLPMESEEEPAKVEAAVVVAAAADEPAPAAADEPAPAPVQKDTAMEELQLAPPAVSESDDVQIVEPKKGPVEETLESLKRDIDELVVPRKVSALYPEPVSPPPYPEPPSLKPFVLTPAAQLVTPPRGSSAIARSPAEPRGDRAVLRPAPGEPRRRSVSEPRRERGRSPRRNRSNSAERRRDRERREGSRRESRRSSRDQTFAGSRTMRSGGSRRSTMQASPRVWRRLRMDRDVEENRPSSRTFRREGSHGIKRPSRYIPGAESDWTTDDEEGQNVAVRPTIEWGPEAPPLLTQFDVDEPPPPPGGWAASAAAPGGWSSEATRPVAEGWLRRPQPAPATPSFPQAQAGGGVFGSQQPLTLPIFREPESQRPSTSKPPGSFLWGAATQLPLDRWRGAVQRYVDGRGRVHEVDVPDMADRRPRRRRAISLPSSPRRNLESYEEVKTRIKRVLEAFNRTPSTKEPNELQWREYHEMMPFWQEKEREYRQSFTFGPAWDFEPPRRMPRLSLGDFEARAETLAHPSPPPRNERLWSMGAAYQGRALSATLTEREMVNPPREVNVGFQPRRVSYTHPCRVAGWVPAMNNAWTEAKNPEPWSRMSTLLVDWRAIDEREKYLAVIEYLNVLYAKRYLMSPDQAMDTDARAYLHSGYEPGGGRWIRPYTPAPELLNRDLFGMIQDILNVTDMRDILPIGELKALEAWERWIMWERHWLKDNEAWRLFAHGVQAQNFTIQQLNSIVESLLWRDTIMRDNYRYAIRKCLDIATQRLRRQSITEITNPDAHRAYRERVRAPVTEHTRVKQIMNTPTNPAVQSCSPEWQLPTEWRREQINHAIQELTRLRATTIEAGRESLRREQELVPEQAQRIVEVNEDPQHQLREAKALPSSVMASSVVRPVTTSQWLANSPHTGLTGGQGRTPIGGHETNVYMGPSGPRAHVRQEFVPGLPVRRGGVAEQRIELRRGEIPIKDDLERKEYDKQLDLDRMMREEVDRYFRNIERGIRNPGSEGGSISSEEDATPHDPEDPEVRRFYEELLTRTPRRSTTQGRLAKFGAGKPRMARKARSVLNRPRTDRARDADDLTAKDGDEELKRKAGAVALRDEKGEWTYIVHKAPIGRWHNIGCVLADSGSDATTIPRHVVRDWKPFVIKKTTEWELGSGKSMVCDEWAFVETMFFLNGRWTPIVLSGPVTDNRDFILQTRDHMKSAKRAEVFLEGRWVWIDMVFPTTTIILLVNQESQSKASWRSSVQANLLSQTGGVSTLRDSKSASTSDEARPRLSERLALPSDNTTDRATTVLAVRGVPPAVEEVPPAAPATTSEEANPEEEAETAKADAEYSGSRCPRVVFDRVMLSHQRQGHAGLERLVGSWREQGSRHLLSIPRKTVASVLAQCPQCALSRVVHHRPHERRSECSWLDEVELDTLHISRFDPEHRQQARGPRGEKFVLGMKDRATGVVMFLPVESRADTHVCRLLNRWFAELGPPRHLRADNALEFISAKVQALCDAKGVVLDLAVPNVHQQGVIEREWRELRAVLRAWHDQFGMGLQYWPYLVCAYEYARNRTAHTGTPRSPLNWRPGSPRTLGGCPGTSA
ncbi:MAG: hypothetical protein ACO32I_04355 [Candidatus Limnocylindrus sp.]